MSQVRFVKETLVCGDHHSADLGVRAQLGQLQPREYLSAENSAKIMEESGLNILKIIEILCLTGEMVREESTQGFKEGVKESCGS